MEAPGVNFPGYVSIQADDIAISIGGETRTTLIQRAEQALIPVIDWAVDRGLSLGWEQVGASGTLI